MTIAYLILCHTDPKHIRRLTEKITKTRMMLLLFMWMENVI